MCYLEIPTTSKSTLLKKGYDKLDTTERVLAERIYGQENDFVENMKMLNDTEIKETRIYVLNPKYVKEHAKESAIGRASWVDIFNGYSSFNAGGRDIGSNGRLRGVRREVAEGDAVKKEVSSAPQEVITPSFDEVRAYSAQFVPDVAREQFELGLRKL